MIINAFDREALRESFQGARPFPLVVIDDFLDREFALEAAAAYPSFAEAQELTTKLESRQVRNFENLHEKAKVQITDSSLFPEPVQRLNDAISASEFLADVAYFTEIPNLLADPQLRGGGMHIHGRQGGLGVHVDFNYLKADELHRRLNIITYLNPRWDDSWGGCFEAWDPPVETCHQLVAPRFNRCVIFRTSNDSFHGVNEITCPAEESRVSFSAFYYTKEAPPWWDGEFKNSIYRPRPDERWKGRVAMPLDEARRRVKRGVESAKGRIKRLLGSDD